MKYILFYKPYGVLSQFTDEGTGHPTLKEYIPVPDVYPAGRLDRDSEGLLFLTDDGKLAHQLTHPVRHVEKTYWVQVEGEVTEGALSRLRAGVLIKGYQTLPCTASTIPEPELPERSKPITPHGPTAWLEVRLREGKKRQIRHMTAAVGLPTLRLVRVAMGTLTLQGLSPGQWREIGHQELSDLRKRIANLLLKNRKRKTPRPKRRGVTRRTRG